MQKLTDEQKTKARNHLKKMAMRSGPVPLPPPKPGDEMATLCGQYLDEIKWEKGQGVPKELKTSLWGRLFG